ncbi:unnamed protein product [Protopolystoma xenopodis]|uniref:Uncharacterized protein n=1 Tax=Protopolystoma xenopodis TaxID=117903 RepID=A0A3S5BQ84_9PLAT|nr:unnamed protein product [Protopolystoma xenopodis]
MDLPLARAIQLRWAEIDVARLVDAQLDREAAARLTETDSVEAEEMREPHKDSILEDNQNGIQQSDDEEGDDATTNTTTTTGTSIKTARSETDAASNSSPLDMKNQGIYQDSSEATSGAESENQNGLDRRGYRPNRGRKQRSRQRRFNNKVSRKETKVAGRRGASARVSSSGPIAARTHQLVGRSGAGARKRSKKGTNTIGDGSAEARNILLATRRLPPKLSPADLTIVGKILKEEPILNQIPSHVARMSKYLSLQLGRTCKYSLYDFLIPASALAKPGTYRGAATVKTNGKRGGRRGGKRSLANGASGAMDAGEETDQGEEEEEEGDEEEADEAECEGEEADAEEEGDVDVEEREDRGEEDSKNEKNRSVATMVFNETTLAINADVIKPEHSVSHEKLYSKVSLIPFFISNKLNYAENLVFEESLNRLMLEYLSFRLKGQMKGIRKLASPETRRIALEL